MFGLKLARLLGKSWSRTSPCPTRARKTTRSPLYLERLEDRTVPSNYLGTTANSFAVLGASTVTNTGPSIVDGNLGVSPGTAITGFPPGTVTPPGVMHAGDAVADEAQNEVTTAYNTLANLPFTTSLTGQDLGGLTLIPGVYNFTTTAQLTGTLTLNDEGNPSALFVIQIGSTLTTASNSSVVFLNGEMDDEVYWQVGSSATLGSDTAFSGNILALASITMNTGASIQCGRALARNGAVTMDDNIVSTVCLTPPGSISGEKFTDLTGSGVLNGSDPGLAGVTVFLDLAGTGVYAAGDPTAVTDANGDYSFTNLPPGTYTVLEEMPTGYIQTTPNLAPIVLASGENVTGENMGDFQLISISGFKFNDLNDSGVYNESDPGLAGVTVFIDLKGTGIYAVGDPVTVTDANGDYTFTNLGPGNYTVLEVEPIGWVQTTANPGVITASSGTNIVGVNFGNYQLPAAGPLGSISGEKFNDLTGSGVQEPNDPGLAGITIFIDLKGTGIFAPGDPYTVTGPNGDYSFSNLPAGNYTIREEEPVGWMQTTSNPAGIAISGNDVTGVDFGNFELASLSGEKFNDLNGNGVLDPGEPGLAGITVFIDLNGTGIYEPNDPSTVTGVNGDLHLHRSGARHLYRPRSGARWLDTNNPQSRGCHGHERRQFHRRELRQLHTHLDQWPQVQ